MISIADWEQLLLTVQSGSSQPNILPKLLMNKVLICWTPDATSLTEHNSEPFDNRSLLGLQSSFCIAIRAAITSEDHRTRHRHLATDIHHDDST